ncbi:hypothetical protein WL06_01565 [Burkholderia cepacia]|nr:hypothetical protein WL06_01565 [Burkholderia cepacia]
MVDQERSGLLRLTCLTVAKEFFFAWFYILTNFRNYLVKFFSLIFVAKEKFEMRCDVFESADGK